MTEVAVPETAMPAWRRRLAPGLKILLSLACLAAVWRWIDPAGLASRFKDLALPSFALAVLLSLFHKVLNAVKVRLLFPAPRPSFLKILNVNFITVFFNAFLPGGIGGEIARWTYLGRETRSKSVALAVILLDRITGLWAQIFLAAAAWFWVSRDRITIWAAGPAIIVVLLGSLWAGLWGYQGLTAGLGRLGAWYARRRGNPEEAPQYIGKALEDLLASRGRFARVALLSLASQALVVAVFMLVDRSVGGDLGMAQAMLFLCCYTIVLLLPVTIGSWGLSEGILGIMYHYSGAQGATGVAISLLLRIMDLPAAFLGWILFLRYRTRKSDILGSAEPGLAGPGPDRPGPDGLPPGLS